MSEARINRLLDIPKAELEDRLRHVRAQDLAVELQVTWDEMETVIAHWKLPDRPEPAPLPEHTTWTPETDQSYPLFIEQGVEHDDAVARIEGAIRWAARWGCMHVDAAGELVREFDPVRLARPIGWRP